MAKKKSAKPKAKKKAVLKKAAEVPMLRCPITGAVAPAGTHGH